MFEWNVEDLVLYNQKGGLFLGREQIYDCENSVSREDKIAFVDSKTDGKLSYILELIDKFNMDKDSLPKDSYGHVKTVSLKAWLKRNDTKYLPMRIIDDYYRYGEYDILGSNRSLLYQKKGVYDTYEDLVDECFHRQLKICRNDEEEYFKKHDEYSILKEKFRDRNYNTTFGVNISEWSNGEIYIINKENKAERREITIDELKYFLSKYEELDKIVEKITQETDIEY